MSLPHSLEHWGHVWLKVGQIDLGGAATDAWGVVREEYIALEGYWASGCREWYSAGELGLAASERAVNGDGFTLANLFFGIWAIVYAAQGNFKWAGWFIVFAGMADILDGRLARMSHTGTRFGAELDSLVDVISFGVAPAMIVYFLEFEEAGKFAWTLCFIYIAAVAVRLARYNITAAGSDKPGWFTGVPSPAAGMTLATYFAFSQTEWYQRFPEYLDLQRQGLIFLMLALSAMMLSTVKYPRTRGSGSAR